MTILEILKDEQQRLNWSTHYAIQLLEKGYPLDFEMGDRSHDELDNLPQYETPAQLSALELMEALDKKGLMIMPSVTFGITDSIQGTVDKFLKEYFTALYKGWRKALKESKNV